MRYGTWDIRSPYRAGPLKTVARELTKCNLDLVAVQEVRSDQRRLYWFLWKWNANGYLGTGFIVHRGICKAVKRVQFISD
jgi:hypothetical protein